MDGVDFSYVASFWKVSSILFFFSFISIGGENLGHGVLGFSCRLLHGHVAGIGAGKIIFVSRLVHVLGFKFFKDKCAAQANFF